MPTAFNFKHSSAKNNAVPLYDSGNTNGTCVQHVTSISTAPGM